MFHGQVANSGIDFEGYSGIVMESLSRRASVVVLIAFCLASVVGMSTPSLSAAEPPKRGEIGATIAPFQLKDAGSKTHALKDWDSKPLLVVAFVGAQCPLAKLYAPRLGELSRKYEARGVGFVAINSNRQDGPAALAEYAKVHRLPFPLLKDVGNIVANDFGAERTPEVYVLDAKRNIRYRGRIDDQYELGVSRDKATTHEVVDALEDLLAGKSVRKPRTNAIGCQIGRIRTPKSNAPVTYSNQIARIFQSRCVECHRPGEIGPFPMTSYEDVVGWAETISETVDSGRMPPWHASPKHGHFKNDRRLSDDEKQMISKWAADGAPEGDRSHLPAPQVFTKGWQLPREPDQVLMMSDVPASIPATGAVTYRYFTVDPGYKEDKWVSAAQIIPGTPGVVHHILILVRPPKGSGVSSGDFLVGFVPGARAGAYPKGMAKRIPAGSKIVFQIHYTPNGSPQTDLSKLGLVFAKPEELTHAVVTLNAIQPRFEIPAHEPNHRVEATSTGVNYELTLLSLMPHLHVRGKDFRYELKYPDGKTEILLDVPRYDFNWQTAYELATPKTIPPGTNMHCVAHYDNSADNPANPDPSSKVRWGEQTWQEMMIGYFDIAVSIDLLRKQGQLGESFSDSENGKAKRPMASSRDSRGGRNRGAAALKMQGEQALRALDKNKDGKLSRSEIPARLLPLFNRLDTNKDGFVTEDEIKAGLGK